MQLVHEISERNPVGCRIEVWAADVNCHQLFTMILLQVMLYLGSADYAGTIVEHSEGESGGFHSDQGAYFDQVEPDGMGDNSPGPRTDGDVGVLFYCGQHGAGFFCFQQFQCQSDAAESGS